MTLVWVGIAAWLLFNVLFVLALWIGRREK